VNSYRKAEADYWTHTEEVEEGRGIRGRLGRETLHLFPAEVNAARLETRIPARLRIGHRSLHNDIVLQLEDMERFRLFVRCWAFGLIRRERRDLGGGYENFWSLELPPIETQSVAGQIPAVTVYLTRPGTGEPDLVEAMKIWNYQRRDVRPDVNVPIEYDRARAAVQVVRDKVIADRLQKGEGVDDPAIRERAALLPSARDKETFPKLWLERRLLKEKQEELKPVIEREGAGVLARDAAIVQFMVLDDDIESLNLAMDDLIKG
jgi:hypothetical protein